MKNYKRRYQCNYLDAKILCMDQTEYHVLKSDWIIA